MQTVKIKSITKLNNKFDKFDLEIQDNHNFFANNILVHNCRCVSMTYDEMCAHEFPSSVKPQSSVPKKTQLT